MSNLAIMSPFIALVLGMLGAVCWDEYKYYEYCKLMGNKYKFIRWND